MEGLKTDLKTFEKMPAKRRDYLIFKNLINQGEKIEKIKKKTESYKLHEQLQYLWLFIISGIIGLRKYLPI